MGGRCIRKPSVADCGVWHPHLDTRCIDDGVPCVPRENFLVEGRSPIWDGGCLTGVSQADEREWDDNFVLRCRQDKPEVAILAPSMGDVG